MSWLSTQAGTRLSSRGEPHLFATDPDGYEIEIWYELPTAVDPQMK